MRGGPRPLPYSSPQAVSRGALIFAETDFDEGRSAEHSEPLPFLTAKLAARERETRQLDRKHLLIGLLRLFWVLVLVALGWLSFGRHLFRWQWLLLSIVPIVLTAQWHARVTAAVAAAAKAVRHYQHAIARVEDRWQGMRPRTTRVDAAQSLYATDLDLFGPASLFELLCTARTTVGEDTLAAWLLAPAAAAEVEARQLAVAELRDSNALRERFASAPGSDVLAVDAKALAAWSQAQGTVLWPAMRWFAPLQPVLLLALAWHCIAVHSATLILPFLLLNYCLTHAQGKGLKAVLGQAEESGRRLTQIAALFALAEHRPAHEPMRTPPLRRVQEELGKGSRSASAALRDLGRLAAAAEQRLNWLTRIFDLTFLFSFQLALLVERWRRAHGAHLQTWLKTLGEFEALLSLSSYHFENPQDVFPEIVTEGAAFEAEALGHPLLPRASAVRNPVSLNQATRLLLISGSNMSGKSTLLRSTGVAAVMALAGAPVRATSLRVSPLQVAASMQILDSLGSGRSHFYAEILRLRAVCERARTHPPVLFLLDELLAGTNSQDRVAGATGVVQELLSAGAFGMLSTHDLALTQMPGSMAGLMRNAHFEDQVVAGELRFDYLLREGVVTRSNGLALMRMIGLDV